MDQIGASELCDRLSAGGTDVEVVDIREADEFAGWNIHGSRNLPVYNDLRANDPTGLVGRAAELDRDRTIVTVCRAGIMSQRAAQVLDSLGFRTASLTGGIRGWSAVWTYADVPFDRPGATFRQVRRNGKGCLSYLFGAEGQAAVVDPCVDVEAYLEEAARLGLKIVRVVETHVHADHLSRARALAARCDAVLMMPKNDRVTFEYEPIENGRSFSVGGIDVVAISTPGHTGESTCYRIDDQVLLSGDTLFVEHVGRPDLEHGDAGAAKGARLLYRSLQEALLTQSDKLFIAPAHHGGAIGFDGAVIGERLGAIKAGLAVTGESEQAFVDRIVASLGAKPPNHEAVISVNEGKADLGGTDPIDLEAGPNRCAAG